MCLCACKVVSVSVYAASIGVCISVQRQLVQNLELGKLSTCARVV